MPNLKPGDVISYSAGTSQQGPNGFRVISNNLDRLLHSICQNRPDLTPKLFENQPLIINAYPASFLNGSQSIFVDSYMNTITASRALNLASHEHRPVVIIGQSLFLAEIIDYHHSLDLNFPGCLILATGGYYMPQSLQDFIERRTAGTEAAIFSFYGLAEVDAGCLIAVERNQTGEPVYRPSAENIEAEIIDGYLNLSIKDEDGNFLFQRYPTKDRAYHCKDGFCIPRENRASESMIRILESWKPDQWSQRTGYLWTDPEGRIKYQTRRHRSPILNSELSFFQFSEKSGQTFLSKPEWGKESPTDLYKSAAKG